MEQPTPALQEATVMVVPRVLIARIRARMAELDTNAAQVSKDARLGSTAVSDILSGKNKNPSVGVVKAVAQILKCDLSYLVGDQEYPRQVVEVLSRSIPIIGTVEAGAFREMPKVVISEHEFS